MKITKTTMTSDTRKMRKNNKKTERISKRKWALRRSPPSLENRITRVTIAVGVRAVRMKMRSVQILQDLLSSTSPTGGNSLQKRAHLPTVTTPMAIKAQIQQNFYAVKSAL